MHNKLTVFLVFALCLLGSTPAWADGRVVPYPRPVGDPAVDDGWFPANPFISVTVDGHPVDVWRTEGKNIAHFGFESGKSVTVVVKYLDEPKGVWGTKILPTAYGIVPKLNTSSGTITFELDSLQRSKVVVRRPAGKREELLIFGGPIHTPPANATYTIRANEPPPSNLDTYKGWYAELGTDDVLYIEPGAVLGLGVRILPGAKNVTITGPGVIRLGNGGSFRRWYFDPKYPLGTAADPLPGSKEGFRRKYYTIPAIEGVSAEGVKVEDVLVTNGIDDNNPDHKKAFQVYFRSTIGIAIKNLKTVASQRQSDGFVLKGCKDVTVDGMFVGTGDNAVLFGGQGLTKNVRFDDVVLYQLGSTHDPQEESGSKASVLIEGNYRDQFWLFPFLHAVRKLLSGVADDRPKYLENFAETVIDDVKFQNLYVIDQFDHEDQPTETHLVGFLGSIPSSSANVWPIKRMTDVRFNNVHLEPHLDDQMLLWAYDHGGSQTRMEFKEPSNIAFNKVRIYRPNDGPEQVGAIRLTSENLSATVKDLRYDGEVVASAVDMQQLRENARIVDLRINEPPTTPSFEVLDTDDPCWVMSWSDTRPYRVGEVVSYNGHSYEARSASLGRKPSTNSGDDSSGEPWREAQTCEACVPSCDGQSCGSDGCGGQCGMCKDPAECNASGHCEAPPECQEPNWSASSVYLAGDTVAHGGRRYTAWHWTQGDDPNLHHGPQSTGLPWGPPGGCSVP